MFSNFRIRYIHRKKYRRRLIPYLGLVGFVGIVGTALLSATNRGQNTDLSDSQLEFGPRRKLLQQATDPTELTSSTTSAYSTSPTTTIPEKCKERNTSDGSSLFIPDIFSQEELRRGAFVCHIFGLIYMFVALAIVCDEFFVPALGVITGKAQISDDVAGATFMAAGGSAPEFFTSAIGVFIAKDNVGIGTIVGSATFNILCVLAFCCLFSKGVLHLTWWPLFRDVAFYILALAFIVISFLDDFVKWHEALVLFIIYILYCTFMKYNERLEVWVKTRILGHSVQILAAEQSSSGHNVQPPPPDGQAAGQLDYGTTYSERGSRPSTGAATGVGPRRRSSASRRQSIPILHSGAMFRNGIVQLMVHTLDPLSELHVDDKLVQLHGMAAVQVVLDRTPIPNRDGVGSRATCHQNPTFAPDAPYPPVPGTPEDDEVFGQGQQPNRPATVGTQNTSSTKVTSMPSLPEENDIHPPRQRKDTQETPLGDHSADFGASYQQNFAGVQNGGFSEDNRKLGPSNGAPPGHTAPTKDTGPMSEDEEIEEPLDMTWPSTCRKQITYIILAPIIFPLWLTIPDVRKPESRKWYPLAFIGSIVWIAIFSYAMVWWANTIGKALDIPTEIMGLTILAAGTSIPDLITSVLVARKGLGDMAVSSSIGSNIFDVCVGLPIPWLLYFIINSFSGSADDTISVESKGLVCTVTMLFVMLIVLITAIGLFDWKMNKPFGIVMIFAYCVFCVISVLLEMDELVCPLKFSECAKYRTT